MKFERFTTILLVTALLVGGLVIANLTAYGEPSAARPPGQRLSYSPSDWQKTVVDVGVGNGDAGQYSSLELDAAQRPRISYYKIAGSFGSLMYAQWRPTGWYIGTSAVDGGQGINWGRYTSLTLDSAGNGHISYQGYSTGSSTNSAAKYAYYNGTKWNTATILDATNGAGQYTSIKLAANGFPCISYYASLADDLRYAFFDGSTWTVEQVDTVGDVGQYSSLALEHGTGVPHIAYKDATHNKVKHAYRTGANTWTKETVADLGGTEGGHISLALDTSNRPHIAFYDSGLKYIYATATNPTTWSSVETVDGTDDPGRFSSLVLDGSNRPRISYFESMNNKLKYAAKLNGTWTTGDVDASGADVGRYSSLALDYLGNPHISYYDASNHALKYAKPVNAPPPFTETPTTAPASTYTPTVTNTPTQTNTPTITPTPSATPTVTLTPTPSNTPRARVYLPVMLKGVPH